MNVGIGLRLELMRQEPAIRLGQFDSLLGNVDDLDFFAQVANL